ncbi:MAG TPA: hypothetical protein VK022_05490, partial [Paracoccaceae bacterium]|nr:hypothetical protein [Paracoccaceae bacterium]
MRSDPAAIALTEHLQRAEREAAGVRQALLDAGTPAPVDVLGRIFGLSPLEQALLVMALAPRVDAAFEQLYGYAHDRLSVVHATQHLAEALLAPDVRPLDIRRALLPESPLRRFRLIEQQALPGRVDMSLLAPIMLDERMADFLLGLNYLDPGAAEYLDPVAPALPAPCHLPLLRPLVSALGDDSRPAVDLVGEPRSGRRGFAAALAAEAGMTLVRLRLERLPAELARRLAQLRRIEREAALLRLAVFVDAASADGGESNRATALEDVLERLEAFAIVASGQPVHSQRPIRYVHLPKPDAASRRALWRQALSAATSEADESEVRSLAAHFDLDSTEILQIAREAAAADGTSGERILWQVAR